MDRAVNGRIIPLLEPIVPTASVLEPLLSSFASVSSPLGCSSFAASSDIVGCGFPSASFKEIKKKKKR